MMRGNWGMVAVFIGIFVLVAGVGLIIVILSKKVEPQSSMHPVTEKQDTNSAYSASEKNVPTGGVRYSKDQDKKPQNESNNFSMEKVPLFRAKGAMRYVWVCQYCEAENEMTYTSCVVCAKTNAGSIYKGVRNVL